MSDDSKKPLLNEATVRRFQTLANLGTIGEGPMAYARDDEEELPMGDEGPVEEPPMDVEEPMDDEEEFPPEDDLEGGLSPEAQALADVIADPVVDAVAQAISTSPDIDVEVTEEPGGEEEGLEDLPAEEPEGLEGEGEGEEDLDLALEQLNNSNIEILDDEKLVAEIAKRVAKRLLSRD